jgi:hypothetical protein
MVSIGPGRFIEFDFCDQKVDEFLSTIAGALLIANALGDTAA